MGTDDFHSVSIAYGLDSQILANYLMLRLDVCIGKHGIVLA
jgi:hypothetical protein